MGAQLPSGTVTFLFTDIEASTRLLHAVGPDAYAEALSEHRRMLRAAFEAQGGVEVDTQGDAFFVAFPTAPGAVAAADAGQQALESGPIRVRMGLHTGTPTVTSEGYVGVDVHRGARVAALAHGGQVLVTEATAALVDGVGLTDLGRHHLKDFDGPTRVHQLGTASFPPLRTPGAVDLPTPATGFIGREPELHRAVTIWIERSPRVLSVIGPGGIGKTRFAIELARLLTDEADGATIFVPLAAVRDPSLVPTTLAARLGSQSAAPEALAAAVGARRTHLVLDNLEHLLPDAATPLAGLVAAAPSLRLIVTSREPLRIQGEIELDLPPLGEDDARTLFLARTRDDRLTDAETSAVDLLCDRLDRLPLAIELAAARTKLLTPSQLLDRIGRRLDLLSGTRDAEERHATLRATIAWSHDLLDDAEQALFARLSTFAAGCTLESAEAVCDADLDVLASLVEKSLVRRRTGASGEERFWMLEMILEYARERLEERGERDDLARRHALRMLAVARSAGLEDHDLSPGQDHAVVAAERDDIRSALDWAAANDVTLGLELAIALENYLVAVDPADGARIVGAMLATAAPLEPRLEAAALRVMNGTLYRSGNREEGIAYLHRSLAAFRALGDERRVASLEGRLAIDAAYHGEIDDARVQAEHIARRAAELGMPRLETQALSALARLAVRDGDPDTARELLRRCAEVARACGFTWWEAGVLENLLDLELEMGHLDDAERTGHDALRVAVSIEEQLLTLAALVGLARIELERGRFERSGALWGAVLAEMERSSPIQRQALEEYARPLAAEDGERFRDAVAVGRAAGLEAAVELALAEAQTEP
jgi:predicted ATPase/class 3 adenylate cyclase